MTAVTQEEITKRATLLASKIRILRKEFADNSTWVESIVGPMISNLKAVRVYLNEANTAGYLDLAQHYLLHAEQMMEKF